MCHHLSGMQLQISQPEMFVLFIYFEPRVTPSVRPADIYYHMMRSLKQKKEEKAGVCGAKPSSMNSKASLM